MTTKTVLLTIAGLVAALFAPARVCPDTRRATVHINSVGLFGTPVSSLRFWLRSIGPSDRTRFRVWGGEATNIPYGLYVVEAETRAVVVKKTIEVNSPFVFVTVGVPLPELDGEIRGIDGVSVPLSEHSPPVWARLIQVFSDTSYETAVREDGGFSFRGIPSGLYLLVIISGEDLLVVRQVPVKLGIQTLSFAHK